MECVQVCMAGNTLFGRAPLAFVRGSCVALAYMCRCGGVEGFGYMVQSDGIVLCTEIELMQSQARKGCVWLVVQLLGGARDAFLCGFDHALHTLSSKHIAIMLT